MSRPLPVRLAGLALAGLAAIAAIGVLGADRQRADTAHSTDTARRADTVSEFAGLFASYGADYDHVPTPAKLAAQSDLVVQGTIVRFDRGRLFGTSATDPVARRSVTMVVAVDRVLRGRLPARSGGKVYVELPAPRKLSVADFNRVAPTASPAVLYLRPAATAADTPLVTPDAGRPVGQPLHQPANPQGFVLQTAGKVVQILEFTEFPGASVADFTPAAAAFPGAVHRD